MYVGNVARKGRGLWNRVGSTWKSLLEEDDTRMARKDVRFQLKEFIVAGDTTDVPGEQVQVQVTVEEGALGEKTGEGRAKDDSRKAGLGWGAARRSSQGEKQQCPFSQQAG